MSQNKSQSKTSRIGSLPASFPASSTTATSASTCSQRTEGNKENQMVKSDVAAVSSQLANKTNSARLLMERQKSDIGVSNAACGSRSTSSRPSGSLYSSSSFDASTLTQQLQKQQQAKKEQPLSSTSTITADVDELSQVKRRKFLDEQMASTFPDKTPTTLSPPPAAQQQQQQQAAATTSNNVVVKSDEIHSSWFDDTDSVSSSAGSRLGSSSIGSSQSSTMSVYDAGACTFYGLPEKCRELLKQLRNISCLYEWQHKLLSDMHERYERAVRERRRQLTNLLYMSPTSGGKTLVAELLMLHCLLMRRKSVVFVMPFVSIVQEKVALMQPFGEQLHFHVEEYAGVKGMLPPLKRNQPAKTTLYICTIEKAHSLVNSLIETGRLAGEIGMLVADELHMIGDGSRGAIYEMILSKVKYCSKAASSAYDSTATANTSSSSSSAIGAAAAAAHQMCIQIVATTATLENKSEVARFLDAELFEGTFRPVELNEYIKIERQVLLVERKLIARVDDDDDSFLVADRRLEMRDYTSEMRKDDPDGLVELVRECIPLESCLVFCSTKKNCENVATLLASFLPAQLKLHKRDLKLKLFNELREENANNVCPVLRQSIQFGIAYHHSGLTVEERQLIEQAYRDGVL